MSPDPRGRALRRLYTQHRASAGRRGIDFTLDEDEHRALVLAPCWYCGAPPCNTLSYAGYELEYSGIDRLDSHRGYGAGNVVPCCRFCNTLKGSMPLARWAGFIVDLVQAWGGQPPEVLVKVAEPSTDRARARYHRGR